MSDHPTPAMLEKFVLGDLSPEEARPIVAHLLRGCASCRGSIGPVLDFLASVEHRPEEDEAFELEDLIDVSEYEAPVERMLEAFYLHGAKAVERKRKTERTLELLRKKGMRAIDIRRQGAYPVYEALLIRSQELRHEDPQQMLDLAGYAVQASQRLDREGFTPEQIADFRARALAEHGNAFRVADRLAEAKNALDRAMQWLRVGTRDPVLNARVMDLRASLLAAQHHYWDALRLLDEVYAIHQRRGDRHDAGRVLISKGTFTGYAGQPSDAIQLIAAGMELIDSQREPSLKAIALNNQLYLMADCGRLDEALDLLCRHREEILACGGRLDRPKLIWIEGRIHAGLGHLDFAEGLLREAREALAEAGVKAHSALAGLDLAVVLLHRGAHDEACSLAQDAFLTFRDLKINDAQAEALLVLHEALEAQILTAAFLQSLADFLRRAEHDPYARYEPRFG